MTHSHADQKGPIPRGREGNLTVVQLETQGPGRTHTIRRKKEVQNLMGKSSLGFQVRGNVAARRNSILNGVRELCHP